MASRRENTTTNRNANSELLGLTSGFIALGMSLGKYMKEYPDSIPQFCHCHHSKRGNLSRTVINSSQTKNSFRKPSKNVSRSYLNSTKSFKDSLKNVSRSFLSSTLQKSNISSPMQKRLRTTASFKSTEPLTMLARVNQIVMQNPWILDEFEYLASFDDLSRHLTNNAAKFFRYLDYSLDQYPALKIILLYDTSKEKLANIIAREPVHVQLLAKLIYKNLRYLRQTLQVIVQPLP